MQITDKVNTKLYSWDIETPAGMFLASFKDIDTKERIRFEISRRRNQLFELVDFLTKNLNTYFVGYNSLNFDAPVITGIYLKYKFWQDMTVQQIIDQIFNLAQRSIYLSNNESFQDYREEQFPGIHIDVYRVNHFDNKHRRVGLKRLEFELDWYSVQENPVNFRKKKMSDKDMDDTIEYCDNDIDATELAFLTTLGKTENSLYKENNQIQLRQDIKENFGIDCLNFSNAKCGDEIIKKYFMEETGLTYKELPRKGTFRGQIKLKHCVPDNIRFETKELQQFLKYVKGVTLKGKQEFKYNLKFKNQTYTFRKGGLHNVIRNKKYYADDNFIIKDLDISGMYPAVIINNEYYPYHLGKAFLKGYSKVYFQRIELKPQAKKDKRIKGIVAGLKEAGNCPYGKSSDIQSWLYDKQMTLATCITGELSLLMLIERMELAGIACIMANTDGASFYLIKSKEEEFNQIWKQWVKDLQSTGFQKASEEQGKDINYEIELVDYKSMIFRDVNNYLAEKTDGEVKYKGAFMQDTELHKNKSKRVVRLALSKYFIDKVPPEDFILGHDNLFDFVARQKSSSDFHYEGIRKILVEDVTDEQLEEIRWPNPPEEEDKEPEKTFDELLSDEEGKLYLKQLYRLEKSRDPSNRTTYHQMVRYIVSKKGEVLLKVKNEDSDSTAVPITSCEAIDNWNYQPLVKELNRIIPGTEKDLVKEVDFWHYVDLAYRIIDPLEGRRHRSRRPSKVPQLQLF